MTFKDIKNPEELLEFMSENITYGYVDEDGNKYDDSDVDNWYKKCYVQTGEDVLKTLVGTCWDQVELERLWFKNHNYKIKTIFIRFELDKDNDLPTHTFLIYEGNNKYYYFENAFYEERGILVFNSIKDIIEHVKNIQFNYSYKYYNAPKEYRDKIVSYEYDELTKKLDIDSYLKHVTKNKI